MNWRTIVTAMALWLLGSVSVWAAGTGDKLWVRTYEGVEGEVVCVQEATVEEFLYAMYYLAPGVEEIISLNGQPVRDTQFAMYAGKIPVESKSVKASTWKPEAEPSITVVDEQRTVFVFDDQQPVQRNDRVLVPFRAIFEQLECEVEWHEQEQLVRGKKGDAVIELWIGKQKARVNGQEVPLDVPAQLINERTMIPIRFVAESLGIEVEWRDNSREVWIHTNSVWN